ncbi:S1 RNA-binding domain-containing protein [Candidatus Bathyarchaeota archaeon]|nr:S1 RNA-binding domain-containing protein [Candidatus Bathyarchaeota archaeon]
MDEIHAILSKAFDRAVHVIKDTLDLLNEGNTVPFIARYRKDVTRAMDEVQLRDLQKEYTSLVNLEERRLTVLKSIEEQGQLNGELEKKIMDATSLTELEDLYLPYKPKRQTRAQKAREAGLEPLANTIIHEQPLSGSREEIAGQFVDEEQGVKTIKDALDGANHIMVETISENPDLRKLLREVIEGGSTISSNETPVPSDIDEKECTGTTPDWERERQKYKDYFDFSLDITTIKPHQVLALNRGENEGFLDVELLTDDEIYMEALSEDIIREPDGIFAEDLERAVKRGYGRAARTIKRETWVSKIMAAKEHAIKVFAMNLKNLLLQPPLKGKRIVAIDPGYRNGCKCAIIDENGKFLDHFTMYPHPPQNKLDEGKNLLASRCKEHGAWTIAIGNGTASRETEMMVADLSRQHEQIEYTIVSESGASVYSASELAREEFPELDVSVRGAISIARRLQDPLPELIKIDPRSIGVGLYQHDVNQTDLSNELNAVVEDCVNAVGVDVNTASVPLLKHVSGLNTRVAKQIVQAREGHGPFKERDELKEVKYVGEKTFQQAAGFLKIYDGKNPFDSTFIHPESYHIAIEILQHLDMKPSDLLDTVRLAEINRKLSSTRIIKQFAKNAGEETIKDIIDALKAPRRDPRDDLPPVILRKDILKAEDLKQGMILKGTVRNVVDFGAFVDIGVKHDGLVHISNIANTFVKNPHDFLSVGDVIDVMILDVDLERKRIQLSIKDALNASKKDNDGEQ